MWDETGGSLTTFRIGIYGVREPLVMLEVYIIKYYTNLYASRVPNGKLPPLISDVRYRISDVRYTLLHSLQ
jgi:hypothetical protein